MQVINQASESLSMRKESHWSKSLHNIQSKWNLLGLLFFYLSFFVNYFQKIWLHFFSFMSMFCACFLSLLQLDLIKITFNWFFSIFFSWSIFILLRKMPKAKSKTIRKDAEEAPEKPKKQKISKKKKTSGKYTWQVLFFKTDPPCNYILIYSSVRRFVILRLDVSKFKLKLHLIYLSFF